MRLAVLGLSLLLVAGCGGGSSGPPTPTGPTPTPVAPPVAPPTFAGSVTDTISGAPVVGFSATLGGGRLVVSAPDYITRDVRAGTSAVDLIPAARFDLDFYRQFARGSVDGNLLALRVLRQSPSFYMEVEGAKGLSAQTAALLEQMARRTVPELTGGKLQVARWETGPTPRPPQDGWVVIERRDLAGGTCGNARVGASAGQIFLDASNKCRVDAVFAHEVGHALGFWHVNIEGSLMYPQYRDSNVNDAPTERERWHAAIAYARAPGNQDIDVDP